MKKELCLLFLALLVIKLLLIPYVPVPLGYSDSLAYFEQAKVFFETGSIKAVTETAKFPPLYGMILSPSYFFNDMNTVFFVMKIINAILSSLVIIPAYLLAREFLNKKKSFMVAAVIAFIPSIFASTFYALSENLYYPLFIFAIYFLFKWYSEKKWYWTGLAFLFICLCLLTKYTAIVLIPIFLIFIIILLPPSVIAYGTETNGIVQHALNHAYLLIFGVFFLLYTEYLILALGIIPFILVFYLFGKYYSLTDKEKKFVIMTIYFTFSIIGLASFMAISGDSPLYTDHRIIGRYIVPLFPLYFIASFIALERKETIKKKYIVGTAIFLGTITPFILFGTFFPVNNMEWIHIELAKNIVNALSFPTTAIITAGLFLATSLLLFIKKYKIKTYATMFLVYFICISLLNTAAIVYDANERWAPLEEVQLGEWITKNIPPEATFYFDPEVLEYFEEGTTIDRTNENERPVAIMAYWIRGDIVNSREILHGEQEENSTYDYFITTKELDLKKVKEGETIKIYKISNEQSF